MHAYIHTYMHTYCQVGERISKVARTVLQRDVWLAPTAQDLFVQHLYPGEGWVEDGSWGKTKACFCVHSQPLTGVCLCVYAFTRTHTHTHTHTHLFTHTLSLTHTFSLFLSFSLSLSLSLSLPLPLPLSPSQSWF